jgi:hypothetical protein
MIWIYAHIKSERLIFVCDFIFGRILHEDYTLVYDTAKFNATSGIKLNYSNESLEGVQVIPAGLLEETGIRGQELNTGEWDGLPILFTNYSEEIPFDIFSATFYLITRYEEYLPAERDKHDRFKCEGSILSVLKCLDKPIIDIWCAKFQEVLTGKEEFSRTYKFISTIDVDNAYAYNFKSFPIKLGATVKSILAGDIEDLKTRFGCYFRQQKDPYETYDYINSVHSEAEVESMFFFLLSKRNEWDKNLPFTNKHLRALVLALQRQNTIAIHPGYHSYQSAETMLEEKLRLEHITEASVTQSRQHFLKFSFPETPRNLLRVGIKEDYSLGYAEQIGFRGGTCTPFQFFDLEKNETTELVFHSSAIMDATLNRYLGLTQKEAVAKSAEVIKEVKAVNGELVTIWHNETLSELREWKGWRHVFKEVITLAKS